MCSLVVSTPKQTMDNEESKQILLLIDTACSTGVDAHVDLLTDTLYMACCRLLFLYAGFGSSRAGRLDQLKWSWELFDSDDNKVSLRRNTSCCLFKDVRSETLDKLRQDLETKIINHTHPPSEKGMLKVMYSVLASVLQDYLWDTPTILSPLPQRVRKRTSEITKEKVQNVIFIISKKFCDVTSKFEMGNREESGRSLGQYFKEELFPDAVCSQLQNKNISLYTLWNNDGTALNHEMFVRYNREMEPIMSDMKGGVIPLCSLVATPTTFQLSSEDDPLVNILKDVNGSVGKVSLALPPTVLGGAYLTRPHPLSAYHHIMVDTGKLIILRLYPINNCCSIPLFEEGPVIFHSLGLVTDLPIDHCLTVYTCAGQSATDQLHAMYSQGFWDHYTTEHDPIHNDDGTDDDLLSSDIIQNHDPTMTSSLKRKRKRDDSVFGSDDAMLSLAYNEDYYHGNMFQDLSNATKRRQSNRLLCRGSFDYKTTANPWKKNNNKGHCLSVLKNWEKVPEIYIKKLKKFNTTSRSEGVNYKRVVCSNIVTDKAVKANHTHTYGGHTHHSNPSDVNDCTPQSDHIPPYGDHTYHCSHTHHCSQGDHTYHCSYAHPCSQGDHTYHCSHARHCSQGHHAFQGDHAHSTDPQTGYTHQNDSTTRSDQSNHSRNNDHTHQSLTDHTHQSLTDQWLSDQVVGMSSDFKKLNINCAKNSRSMVLEIYSCHGNCNRLAVMHSLTPSISVLSLIRPSRTDEVLSSLKNQSHDAPSISTVAATRSHPTYLDTNLSLHSLFPRQSHDRSCDRPGTSPKDGPLRSSLLHPPSPILSNDIFSQEYLSDWNHLLPKYGIDNVAMERLKEYYSDISLANLADNSSSKLLTHLKKLYSPEKLGGLINTEESSTSNDVVLSFENVLTEFKECYSKYRSESNIEVDVCLQWSIAVTDQLYKSFSGSCDDLWEEFDNKVLLSNSRLKQLQTESMQETKLINEYVLQVFLHFSCSKYFSFLVESIIGERIVSLLRRISFIADPTYVGKLLDDTILNQFKDTSIILLKDVFNQLMMPLPKCIITSPDENESIVSNYGNEEDNIVNDTIISEPRSLETFLEMKEKETKPLQRYASFQRQITVSSHHKKCRSKEEKKVRRSLFDRSYSYSGEKLRNKKKKNYRLQNRMEEKHDIVVKETPLKKQVENYRKFKLERLRSKSNIIDQVRVIEESPKRSFYSTGLIQDDNPLPTAAKAIVFKTPPSKLMSPRVDGCGNKNLSSAALRSLLESDFSSPIDTPTNSQNDSKRVRPSTPELFDASPLIVTTPKSMIVPQQMTTPITSLLLSQYRGRDSPLCKPRIILTKIKPSDFIKNSPSTGMFSDTAKSQQYPPSGIHPSATPPSCLPATPLSNTSTPLLNAPLIKNNSPPDNYTFDDGASSMAFALCTPTKSDSINFTNCLDNLREL